jgi:hypothetical protein
MRSKRSYAKSVGRRTKTMRKDKVITGILIAAAFTMLVASAAGHIAIREVWTEEEDYTGYIDYQSMVDHNTTGNVTIYIDNEMLLEEQVNMSVRLFHGFLIKRLETLKYTLNATEGEHFIAAYIQSENVTVNASCSYYIEGTEEEETEEEQDDWLSCP